ncbi:MAG: ATP-dependent Clp protease ATP-binding subunit ClpX [Alphaproteobacteria bacterium]|jgi:ATP-dependent Clp protease ATP-binding subunit ClpX
MKTTTTFKGKDITKMIEQIYKFSGENLLRAIVSSGSTPEKLLEAVENGTAVWPKIALSQEGDNVLMNVKINGDIVQQEFITPADDAETNQKACTVVNIKDILNMLDTHLIGQTKAKRACALAVNLHTQLCFGEPTTNNTQLKKQNALIYGPPGCGKTDIWELISEHLGIPVFIEDATNLSPASYKGRNVSEMAKDIWLQNGKDMEKSEYSIVVLDEFDKLANGLGSNEKRDVLNDLLKFIDGGVISFKENQMSPHTHFLNTKKVLVVALGAFENIEQLFTKKGEIGFGAESTQSETPEYNDICDKIGNNEFNQWGFNNQILRRFPIRETARQLTVDEMLDIQFNVPNSIYAQWIELFSRLDQNVELTITKPVAEYIAKQAIQHNTGASELTAQYKVLLSDTYIDAQINESISKVRIHIKNGEPHIQCSMSNTAAFIEGVFEQAIAES